MEKEDFMYTYYSTLRPTGPGTCPKGFVEFENWDKRREVDGIMAWGTVTYKRELSEKEAYSYDLVKVEK